MRKTYFLILCFVALLYGKAGAQTTYTASPSGKTTAPTANKTCGSGSGAINMSISAKLLMRFVSNQSGKLVFELSRESGGAITNGFDMHLKSNEACGAVVTALPGQAGGKTTYQITAPAHTSGSKTFAISILSTDKAHYFTNPVTVTATTPQATNYSFGVTCNPCYGGTVTVNGASKPLAYSGSFAQNTTVSYSIVAASGYRVKNTVLNNTSSVNLTGSLTMNQNHTIAATFEAIPAQTYSLNVSSSTGVGGKVKINGTLASLPSSTNRNQNENVLIEAVPDAGYNLIAVVKNGAGMSTTSYNQTIAMTANTTIVFTFEKATSTASPCQCPIYARKVLGITTGIGNATDWTTNLPPLGYKLIAADEVAKHLAASKRTILVIKANANNGLGTEGQEAGHVGFVQSFANNVISIKGSNQSQPNEWTDLGCSNVSLMNWTYRSAYGFFYVANSDYIPTTTLNLTAGILAVVSPVSIGNNILVFGKEKSITFSIKNISSSAVTRGVILYLVQNGVAKFKIWDNNESLLTLAAGETKPFTVNGVVQAPAGIYEMRLVGDNKPLADITINSPLIVPSGSGTNKVTLEIKAAQVNAKPTVSITSHTNGASVTNPAITLSGSAADDASVTAVEVSLNNGGYVRATGTNSWSAALNLTQGANTISVRSYDGSLYSEISTITVNYTKPNNRPTVAITSPANGSSFTSPDVQVSGTASDDASLSYVEVQLNGSAAWVRATGTTSWNGVSLTLREGENNIIARSFDGFMFSDDAVSKVTYTKPATKPTITITSPATNSSSATQIIDVTGTVSGGTSTVEVRVNGGTWNAATLTGTSWTIKVSLDQEQNAIEARASDGSLTSEIASINVSYAKPNAKPTIIITSPATNSSSATQTIDVTGTSADDAAVSYVEVRINGGPWVKATGTNPWTVKATLTQEQNTIEARSYDGSLYSDVSTINVSYIKPATSNDITLTFPTESIGAGQSKWIPFSFINPRQTELKGIDLAIESTNTNVSLTGQIKLSDAFAASYKLAGISLAGKTISAGIYATGTPIKTVSGILGYVEVKANGPAGSSTTFSFPKVVVNEITEKGEFGTISITASDFYLSGSVKYFSNSAPISGVQVKINQALKTTDAAGVYKSDASQNGNYTVSAQKTQSSVKDAISSTDAALAYQHYNGSANPALTCEQLIAADVTMDGVISSLDLSNIARFAVGAIGFDKFNSAGVAWVFFEKGSCANGKAPTTKTLNLTADATLEFVGVLLGDITGTYSQAIDGRIKKSDSKIGLGEAKIQGAKAIFPLQIKAESFEGADLSLILPQGVSLAGIKLAKGFEKYGLEYSENKGMIRIAFYAKEKTANFVENTVFADLELHCLPFAKTRELTFARADVNEQNALQNAKNGELPAEGSNEQIGASLNVYPNPASENATLSLRLDGFEGKAFVHIYDAKGVLVKSLETVATAGKGDAQLSCSGLAPGVYNIKAVAGDKTLHTRLVVE